MKKVIGVLLFALAFAASAQETETKEDWKPKCEKAGVLAKTIMEGRLAGVSMGKMMSLVRSGGLSEMMIIEAYDSPRYETPAVQQRAIEEFRDKWYATCVKALREE